MEILTTQEIHQLAMQEVGTYLENEGFEFLAVNSQIKRSPQFVCVKDKTLYFVVAQGCLYPNAPKDFDSVKLEKSNLMRKRITLNCILLEWDLLMQTIMKNL